MPRTYSLALDFRVPKKAEMPCEPHAQICLQYWTSDKNNVFLSSDCVSLREVKYEISRLRRELDAIESQAERKFAAYKKREAAWIASH